MKSTIAKKTEGYGYKYTELADINKYCEDNGIRYYQEVETSEINQKDYIITYLVKDNETTKHRGCQIVQAVLSGIKNPVQEYGSSLTYSRRYSLLMALGLATEDDDGATFTEREVTKEEALAYTLPYGKHKGKKLTEVPEDYIDWMLGNNTDDRVLKMIEIATGKKIPSEEDQETKLKLLVELNDLITQKGISRENMYKTYKVESDKDMTVEQLREAIGKLIYGWDFNKSIKPRRLRLHSKLLSR